MRRSTLSLRGHAAPVPQGRLFHCVAIRPPPGVFRACGREPPAAPFLSTAKEMGKRAPAKTTFLHFLGAERDVLRRQSLPRDCGGGSFLSVQRTVPPQLSATAPLPLPVATVGAFGSTGRADVPKGTCCAASGGISPYGGARIATSGCALLAMTGRAAGRGLLFAAECGIRVDRKPARCTPDVHNQNRRIMP